MIKPTPLLTIGLPVYNAERYLKDALDSILGQSYKNFRLVISDNASSDSTQSICQSYALRDDRITYIRQQHNLGAASNFDFVFKQCDTPFFKWAAHDDVLGKDYLKLCVSALENDDDISVAHTRTTLVDDKLEELKYDDRIKGSVDKSGRIWHGDPNIKSGLFAHDPYTRFHTMLTQTKYCVEVFGVLRTEQLKNSSLMGAYYGSDRVLMAELSLKGRFYQDDRYSFFRRCHAEQSSNTTDPNTNANWIKGTNNKVTIVPEQYYIARGFILAIANSDLRVSDKIKGYIAILKFGIQPKKLRRLLVFGEKNYFGIKRIKLSFK